MIYGYIRVSTDKQTVENQRYEINSFCESKTLIVHKWIEPKKVIRILDCWYLEGFIAVPEPCKPFPSFHGQG
jgi:hypothetical protein